MRTSRFNLAESPRKPVSGERSELREAAFEEERGAPRLAVRCWRWRLFDELLELAELRAEAAHGFANLAKAALVAPQGSVCGAQLGLECLHLDRELVEPARLDRDDHHGDDQDHRE